MHACYAYYYTLEAQQTCRMQHHTDDREYVSDRHGARRFTYLHVLQPVRFFGFQALWRGLPAGTAMARFGFTYDAKSDEDEDAIRADK
jgi:predicted P-loop ATPase